MKVGYDRRSSAYMKSFKLSFLNVDGILLA
jgi:hypothetical protein